MDTKQLTLILIRVGPTTWDTQGRLCGRADVPPAAGCVESARQLLEGIWPPVELILHGPGLASETIAKALGESTALPVKAQVGLEEVNYGLWDGMLEQEAERRYPSMYRRWRLDPALASPPSGEEIAAAQVRLANAVRKGVGRVPAKGRVVAVLLRPLAFGALATALEGMPSSSIWALVQGTECVRRVTIDPEALKMVTDVRSRVGA